MQPRPNRTFAFAFLAALVAVASLSASNPKASGVQGASPEEPFDASHFDVQPRPRAAGASRSLRIESSLPGRLPHRLDHRPQSLARVSRAPRACDLCSAGDSSRSGVGPSRRETPEIAWRRIPRLVRRARQLPDRAFDDGELATEAGAIGETAGAQGRRARSLRILT